MARYFTLDLVPQNGGQLGTVAAQVFYANTSSTVPIFQDELLTAPLVNPIILYGNSSNVSFWVNNGAIDYDIKLTGNRLSSAIAIKAIWALPGPIWADRSTFWANEPEVWAFINPYVVTTKTIANTGQMYTGNSLIRAAMRLLQVAVADTDLTAAELSDGLQSLNRMLDSWSLDELMLYEVIREQFFLNPGQNPYSIGLGGDFDTVRPSKIVGAYLTITNGSMPVDYPMQVLNYDDYNAIRLKTLQTNFPGYLYYQPSFPIAECFIYPIYAPNGASTQPGTITLTSWKPFNMIVDPTANIELPPGYWEAIVFNLAVRLADEYQYTVSTTTGSIAVSALMRLKRMNQRTVTLQTDIALMSDRQLRYNIYSDSTGR